ncbi:MAG: carboxypeptidase-like regulatory domain-containing protein [Bacteroidales bacterium]|jgi:hypothetical protein|nr:carboxypeptidase-like regulatory domain-containing protein [Bacteroidales bacterium]
MNIKQKIVLIIGLFLSVLSELHAENGHIYGKVVDGNTGERLNNVTVFLSKGSTTSRFTIEENGEYIFENITPDIYILSFKRIEYDDFSYTSFQVNAGDSIRKDVPLQKPLRFIRVTDVGNYNKVIETLDIGDFKGGGPFEYISFSNEGGVDIEYVIGKMNEWITEISPSSGILKPGDLQPIKIKIDPDKFEAGKTTGKVLIITNNGNKVLNIKAIGKFPEIITLSPRQDFSFSDNDYVPNAFSTEIRFNGRRTFKEMGYCFSDLNPIPTINDDVVLANDIVNFDYKEYWAFGMTGKHSFPWLEHNDGQLFDPRFACRTYYVRAFIKYENENNTIIYSSNVAEFILGKIFCP